MDSSKKTDTTPSGPAFLLKSRQHITNLTKLKNSIDSRQGLTIVLGETGAGKTVLCDELAKEYRTDTTTALLVLPDPLFASASDFLGSLTKLFGNDVPQEGLTDNQLKESVKKYLFAQCAAEKKTMLVLINRGDELPDFCLRIIEELYKFHLDAHKLLQVVLFGGKKLQEKIAAFQDLPSYVHGYHTQGPMTLTEAREMIRLLSAQLARDKGAEISFSLPAQWIIYRAAKGYPGRIIALCQLIRLTLALHNTAKADWYIAQMCAKMLYPEQAIKMQRVRIAGLTAILVVAVIYGVGLNKSPQPSGWPPKKVTLQTAQQPAPAQGMQQQIIKEEPSTKTVESTMPTVESPKTNAQMAKVKPPVSVPKNSTASIAEPLANSAEVASKKKTKPQKENPPTERAAAPPPATEASASLPQLNPLAIKKTAQASTKVESSTKELTPAQRLGNLSPSVVLGEITIQRQETLGDMIRKLYGPYSFNKQNTNIVLQVNPKIKSPSLLKIGDTIRFPAIPVKLLPDADKVWWLQFAVFENIANSYRFLKQHSNTPPMLIIPAISKQGRLQFHIIAQEYYKDKAEALATKKMLIPAIFSEVTVLSGLDSDKFYYTTK